MLPAAYLYSYRSSGLSFRRRTSGNLAAAAAWIPQNLAALDPELPAVQYGDLVALKFRGGSGLIFWGLGPAQASYFGLGLLRA
jgi:hypothetical protein